jgi:hypothetical protein
VKDTHSCSDARRLQTDARLTHRARVWLARLAVGTVFAANLACAAAFITRPETYAGAFELTGIPGAVAVRGIGILFLMWNATYPLVLLSPSRHRPLFGVILVQQAVGVVGETWMLLSLPAGHAALRRTGLRFIAFDFGGLILMAIAYHLLSASAPRTLSGSGDQSSGRR